MKKVTIIIALLTIVVSGMAQSVSFTGLNSGAVYGKTFNDLTLTNCSNVIITDNVIKNSLNSGIRLINCTNITIAHDTISNVKSGVYAEGCWAINVHDNYMLDMQGPMPQAQFVQFNNSTGRITNNNLVNEPGKSNPEDAINIYKSFGTADNPIMISGNKIRGGGPSASGGGIMLGDTGGAWQIAQNNTVINPGEYGMAVAGGDHISIINNTIYAKQAPFTNVALYAWAQGGVTASNINISGNRVNWTNNAGVVNCFWNGGNVGVITGWVSNIYDKTLTEN